MRLFYPSGDETAEYLTRPTQITYRTLLHIQTNQRNICPALGLTILGHAMSKVVRDMVLFRTLSAFDMLTYLFIHPLPV